MPTRNPTSIPGMGTAIPRGSLDPANPFNDATGRDGMLQWMNWEVQHNPNYHLPDGYTQEAGGVVREEPNFIFTHAWLIPLMGIGAGAAAAALVGGGAAAAGGEAAAAGSEAASGGAAAAGAGTGAAAGTGTAAAAGGLAPSTTNALIGAGATIGGTALAGAMQPDPDAPRVPFTGGLTNPETRLNEAVSKIHDLWGPAVDRLAHPQQVHDSFDPHLPTIDATHFPASVGLAPVRRSAPPMGNASTGGAPPSGGVDAQSQGALDLLQILARRNSTAFTPGNGLGAPSNLTNPRVGPGTAR